MARKKEPRIVRTSGVENSANGKYFYWKCAVSGIETFADKKRFKAIVKNYGSEEKLVKAYVLRPVQKYLKAGFHAATIAEMAQKNNGKLPALDVAFSDETVVLTKKQPRKGSKQASVTTTDVVGELAVEIEPVVVYPWTGNPDFFKSPQVPVWVGEITKDVCLYPNRNLTNKCRGCSVYAECACAAKFTEENWSNPIEGEELKITPLVSFHN
jgi:hypothetical protein